MTADADAFDELAGGATEPSAEARMGAAQCWQAYAGFVGVGFTPEQATFLLGQILHGQAMGAALRPDE